MITADFDAGLGKLKSIAERSQTVADAEAKASALDATASKAEAAADAAKAEVAALCGTAARESE